MDTPTLFLIRDIANGTLIICVIAILILNQMKKDKEEK